MIAGDLAIIMIPEELLMSGKLSLMSSALIDRAINAFIHTPPARGYRGSIFVITVLLKNHSIDYIS